MNEVEPENQNAEPPPSNGWGSASDRPLKGREAAELARQMSELAASGLPLGSGLRAVAAELRPRDPLRNRLRLLADDLEAGVSLEEALASQEATFPPHFRGLVEAGVRSGRLPEMLGEFAIHDRLAHELRRRVWLGLFYPALLVVICFVLLGALAMASRALVEVVRDFGVQLPFLSQILVTFGESMIRFGWWIFLGPLLTLALLFLLIRVMFSPHERRRLLRGVPLLGPMVRWTSLSELCRVLSLLVESGLALPEALPLAGRATRDAVLARACESAASELADGRPLADALAAHKALPPDFDRFLSWAEGYRSLPESLSLAAGIFEARARAQADFLVSFMTALVILLVLQGLFLTVNGVLRPLIMLISKLSG